MLWAAVREAFTNWRLALLALTGLILSLASGWTTWDGMSNFTCPQGKNVGLCIAPMVLSFMITFGIQGVMLIAAWLIGETFASNASAQRVQKAGWFFGGLLVAAGMSVIAILFLIFTQGAIPSFGTSFRGIGGSWLAPSIGAGSLIAGIVVLFVILSRREIAAPYLDGAKTILRNLPLWIMFLSCMAASVFFSFDSLFSTIFPKTERVRAAKLRVANQVSGVLSDVHARIGERRIDFTRTLFASQEWRRFDANLTKLVGQAESAPLAIQNLKLQKVTSANKAQAEIRAAIAAVETEQQTLKAESDRLNGEISSAATRLEPEQKKIAGFEERLIDKRAEIVTARIAAEGELTGVRGTGNAGAGPEYRKLRKIVQNLELDGDEIETRLNAAKARIAKISDEANGRRQRLLIVNQRLAALDSERSAATQRQTVLAQTGLNDLAADLDAAGGLKALAVERNKFRREPVEGSLTRLEQLCSSLHATLKSVPSLRQGTSAVDCEPGDAGVVATAIFKMNAAEDAFRNDCAAGQKLPRGSANKMLNFGSTCVQNSGLPGVDTAGFRTKLNRIALGRDDKAHRFVVTWNAFSDGNHLAYLALAIAIAIDGLVFMSGIFGANAIRSPLSGVSQQRLEHTIDTALGHDKYEAADRVIHAISKNPDAGFGSFKHQVPRASAETDSSVQAVLTAGMALDAVRWDHRTERYLVHADFNTYLNQISSRNPALENDLQALLAHALAPDIAANADNVLGAIQPDSSKAGFMGFAYHGQPGDSMSQEASMVVLQRAISAGASVGAVHADFKGGQSFIRPEFYACLVTLRTYDGDAAASGEHGSGPVSDLARRQPGGIKLVQSHLSASVAPLRDAEEFDHESRVRGEVRSFVETHVELDRITHSRAQDLANTVGNIVENLSDLEGPFAKKIIDRIEHRAKDLVDQLQPLKQNYDQPDHTIIDDEMNRLAWAIAAIEGQNFWRTRARSLVDDYRRIYQIPRDDRDSADPSQPVMPELENLIERAEALSAHESFDSELIALVGDADKADHLLAGLNDDDQTMKWQLN